MKLLWIVGSAASFGPAGHYPAGFTQKSFAAKAQDIPDWVRTCALLAKAAGLVHDIGKATHWFQEKLDPAKMRINSGPDPVRHEWLSMKVLQHLRKNGYNWDQAWNVVHARIEALTLGNRELNNRSKHSVADALEAIDFLVVSHHGLLQSPRTVPTNPVLPTAKDRHIRPNYNSDLDKLKPAGDLDPAVLAEYRKQESKLIQASQGRSKNYWKAVSIYSRAALILADHTISSMDMPTQSPKNGLFANSTGEGKGKRLKQSLDDHLLTVGQLAQSTIWRMFKLTRGANRDLADSLLHGLSAESVESINQRVDVKSRFNWQNRCADALASMCEKYPNAPHLIFNTAATGSGKTRMNSRAICVLSREPSPRISIALNLRSLTLQTGRSIETGLGIDKSELSVVIGDLTTQELFKKSELNKAQLKDDDENPVEPDTCVEGSAYDLPFWIKSFLKKDQEQTIMGAPLLVSTVDYLCSAGNLGEQGHHVKAILRCMSSDLILDEIDSYEPESLGAVLRLVQLAALFRRNVVCSSATLSLATAQAVDAAFSSGVRMLEDLEFSDSKDGSSPNIGYVRTFIDDELTPEGDLVASNDKAFSMVYQRRLDQIAHAAEQKPSYRIAKLCRISQGNLNTRGWQNAVLESVSEMHSLNSWQYGTSTKKVSFGLVRVANVKPAIELARYLAESLPNAMVAAYHAADFRISRFQKERRLDFLLSRQQGNRNILDDKDIQTIVSNSLHDEIIFLIVATPVEEVGRDHDFDWAVIEPSSAQSIVQTSGRVNRHRLATRSKPNITILQYNLRHCKNLEKGDPEARAFAWPGFEDDDGYEEYCHHDISQLLPWDDELLIINSKLRFDNARCRLADADDKQINRRISPFFGENGVFVSDDPHSWLLTGTDQSPYGKTPLRGNDKKDVWRIAIDNDSHPRFERLERIINHKTNRPKDEWLDQSGLMSMRENIPPNAWLVTDPVSMLKVCEEFSVDPNEGLQMEISQRDSLQRLEYDVAFGVMRLDP
jgi:CRISPR-associated endonuclease/helicase Cas3